MSDEAKVLFLFRKVQHTGLRSSIDTLKYLQTTGTTIYYTMARKKLSTATSELPEYIAKNTRNVSGGQVGDGTKDGDVIYNGYGTINTGHIPSWKLLPFKDLNLVIDERERLGIRYKGRSGAKSGECGNSNHAAADYNRFKLLKEHNQKYKTKVKALKISNNSEDDTDKEELDAGDEFGGRASKNKTRFSTST